MSSIATFQPPTDLVADAGAEAFFTILMAVIVAGALAWALREREWILVILLPFAAISSLIEPVYDYLGHAWWSDNLTSLFESFDGRVYSPTIFPLGYAIWIGIGSYAAFRLFQHRPDRAWLMKAFFLLALCEPALEMPWLITNLFEYFGDQPYRVFGYSLVWDGINTAGIVINGAILLYLSDTGRLRGSGKWIVAILPFSVIGWYFAAGWPTWLAMHADAPGFVIWIGGTISIALSAAVTTLVIRWVAAYRAGSIERTKAERGPNGDRRAGRESVGAEVGGPSA